MFSLRVLCFRYVYCVFDMCVVFSLCVLCFRCVSIVFSVFVLYFRYVLYFRCVCCVFAVCMCVYPQLNFPMVQIHTNRARSFQLLNLYY